MRGKTRKRRGRSGEKRRRGKEEAEEKGTALGSQEMTRLHRVLGKWSSDQPGPQLLAGAPCFPARPPSQAVRL